LIRLGNILLTLLLIGALAAAVAGVWLAHEIGAPGPLAAEKLLYIEPGSSIRAISARLLEAEVIRDDLPFLIAARWQNRTTELKAGEYRIPPGIAIRDVIALLQSGKTYQRRITIPEGLMVVEIIGLLKNEPALTGDIADLPPEGSLLPETYGFSYHDTRAGIVERMKKSMAGALADLWEKRDPAIPLRTPAEAVILASIVERETGLPGERPRVAGVFTNRLKRGIPLQSDPTVIYAVTLGHEKLDRQLTYKDLKQPSAYNTYVIKGLPPTPIASPGKASLAAVLHPEENDYIYFVADGTGGHVFARTLKEHARNVAHWRAVEKKAR